MIAKLRKREVCVSVAGEWRRNTKAVINSRRQTPTLRPSTGNLASTNPPLHSHKRRCFLRMLPRERTTRRPLLIWHPQMTSEISCLCPLGEQRNSPRAAKGRQTLRPRLGRPLRAGQKASQGSCSRSLETMLLAWPSRRAYVLESKPANSSPSSSGRKPGRRDGEC